MVDGTDTTPASPGASAPPADDLEAKKRAAAAETANIVQQRDASWAKEKAGIAGGIAGAAGIKPPNYPAVPPLPPQETTSPAEAWGSLAMLAAAIGGPKSRTHATTAMNAAADVLKGFHQGDLERNQQAIERWKIANGNLMQNMNYQMDIYKAVMAGQGRSVSEMLALSREDRLQASADAAAYSRSFHDDLMTHKLEMGDWNGAVKLLQDREKVYEGLLKQSGRVDDAIDLMQRLDELRNSDEYKKASVTDKYGMEYGLLKQVAPFMDVRGKGSKQDLQIAQQVYKTTYAPGGVLATDAPKFDDWYKNDWPNWDGGAQMSNGVAPGMLDPVAPKDKKKWVWKNPADGKTYRYKGTGDYHKEENWEALPDAAPAQPAQPASNPPPSNAVVPDQSSSRAAGWGS